MKTHVPSSADGYYEVGDLVYVWRETPRLWTGPYSVLGVEGRNIVLKVGSNPPKLFDVTRVKRAIGLADGLWAVVLEGNDPRTNSPEMAAALRAEIVSLIRRGPFRLVIFPAIHGENVVPPSFVLAIKHATKGEASSYPGCTAKESVLRPLEATPFF